MDHLDVRGSDHVDIDLERGQNTIERNQSKGVLSIQDGKKMLNRAWSGSIRRDGSSRAGVGLNPFRKVSSCGKFSDDDVKAMSDKLAETVDHLPEKQVTVENPIRLKLKRPPKPPRPPRRPSLDIVDKRLVQEITELAMLKRRRIERMKSLRKRKAQKGSVFNSSLFALVITFVFVIVIISQGVLRSHV